MHLSKSDIFQAAMIGLTLLASAVAVPVMASGHDSHSNALPTPHASQQLAPDNP
jgi:hypothetical protein